MKHAPFISQKSDKHNTPSEVLAPVIACFGKIELDPCSNCHVSPNVPALKHFTQEDNGLIQSWIAKTVFMNPPYSEVALWTKKLITEYQAGNTKEAIALVKADFSTRWFQPLWNYPICFVNKRLRFEGNNASATFASALVYFGSDLPRFCEAFKSLGITAQRVP